LTPLVISAFHYFGHIFATEWDNEAKFGRVFLQKQQILMQKNYQFHQI